MHRLVLLILLCIHSLMAQDTDKKLWTVGIKHTPPFVILEEGKDPSGFSIDLLHKVLPKMHPDYNIQYKITRNLTEHLQQVKNQEVDIAIAATTITAKRAEVIDFSFPFYYSGLGILVKQHHARTTSEIIFSSSLLWLLISLTIYLFVCANLIWLSEHGSGTFSNSWFHGVMEGLWWTVVTMSTVGYGDFVPQRPWSRLLSIFVIFSGIFLFGLVIASFTSALTINQIHSDIEGPNDLIAHRVAVIQGTTAEHSMHEAHAKIILKKNLKESVKALMAGKVHAVVHDMPLIKHYIQISGSEDDLAIVGGIFEPSNYGMTLPSGSNYTKKINIALLQCMESPFYRKLYQKWFGFGEINWQK